MHTISDPRLILPKAAYFFFFGANSLVVPFLAVFLKTQCGLKAHQIGALMGGTRLVGVVAAPAWTYLADRLRRRRVVLAVAWLAWTQATLLLATVAPRGGRAALDALSRAVRVQCSTV